MAFMLVVRGKALQGYVILPKVLYCCCCCCYWWWLLPYCNFDISSQKGVQVAVKMFFAYKLMLMLFFVKKNVNHFSIFYVCVKWSFLSSEINSSYCREWRSEFHCGNSVFYVDGSQSLFYHYHPKCMLGFLKKLF